MSFKSENEMAEPVKCWLESQNLLVKSEYPTPWGICDLVGLNMDENRVKIRLEQRQFAAIGATRRIAILQKIPDIEKTRAISSRSLSKIFCDRIDEDDMMEALNFLESKRFIKKVKGNCYQRLNGWMPLHKRILAIELKLNRISEALFQAANHWQFATECYAAFPHELAIKLLSIKQIAEFRNLGIGILGVTPQNCNIILASNQNCHSANSIMQMHCVERFWRGYFKGN